MQISFKNEVGTKGKITNDQIISLILKSRNIKNLDEFLNPPSPLSLTLKDFGPYEKSFKKVIKILNEIKEKNQMIVVYTDYDADGITGGTILWETLHLLGFKVMPYVPHRKKEGYGFSKTGIDNVKREFDPALIISVDHGITKIDEIKYAAKLGIKIIVTDHHLKGDKIPDEAAAIFHIPSLSGSGVSYFFAKEVYNSFPKNKQLELNFSVDYPAIASIGTIADLVPLVGPSRALVKYGLENFSKVKRFGIKHILKQAGIEDKKITPYEVGFMIAPRINAIGRLEHAIDALRLLCTNDEKKAYDLAHKIGNVNVERQELVEKSVKEAEKMMESEIPKIITLVSSHWNEGIIGLIASKIADQFYRPTLVLTKTDVGYKGSARSIPSFHVTDFLRSLKKYLIDAGGHKQAAGFTLRDDQLKNFIKAVQKSAEKLINNKDLVRKITADLKIPIQQIDLRLVKSLEKLEPFGIGNPRPVFYSEGILTGAQLLGKTQKHLKIYVDGLELLAFNQADKFKELSRGQKVSVVYNLEVDRWNGRERLMGKLQWLST
jgi:single-stranded-DNA-specific exonuclease